MQDGDLRGISIDDAVRAVESVLGGAEPAGSISPDATFDDLGLSSLDFAEVLVAIEETVGGEVDADSISEDLITVADLAKLRLVGAGQVSA